MPNLNDYAALSAIVYNDVRDKKNALTALPAGWDEMNYVSSPGFTAGSYRNGDDIVIAYKGSDSPQAFDVKAFDDWALTNFTGGLGLGAQQFVFAALFYQSVKAEHSGANITFAGHSMGGGIASLMAVYFDRPAKTFDQAPFLFTVANPVITGYIGLALALNGIGDSAFSTYASSLGLVLSERLANVESYFIPGEFVSFFRTPYTSIGSDTPIPVGGVDKVSTFDLHSMNLAAAALMQPKFRTDTVALPDLLAQLFDGKLYRAPLGESVPDLLTKLVNDQIRVGYDNPDGLLARFATDLEKLIGSSGIAQTVLQKELSIVAMEYYYFKDPASATSIFSLSDGALHFKYSDIGATGYKSLPRLTKAVQDMFGTTERPYAFMLTSQDAWHIQQGSASALWSAGGGAENDAAIGGNGNDEFDGGAGRDILVGWHGSDSIKGGAGDDVLLGGDGDDTLEGGANEDTLIGGTGSDTYVFFAGSGGDTIIDADGVGTIKIDNAQIAGGEKGGADYWTGADSNGVQHRYTLVSNGSGGKNLLISQDNGADQITIRNWQAGQLGITLSGEVANGQAGNTYVGDFKKLLNNGQYVHEYGSDQIGYRYANDGAEPGAADAIIGSPLNDDIQGMAGNDALSGMEGDDVIDGGDGADVLSGGLGRDTLYGGNGDDYLYGSGWGFMDAQPRSVDSLPLTAEGTELARGFGWVIGSRNGSISTYVIEGVDVYQIPSDSANLIDGGAGNDRIEAGTGNDVAHGGTGNDSIEGLSGHDVLYGDDGNDSIFGDGIAIPNSGGGFDRYTNYTPGEQHGNDIIDGGAGNDYLLGQGGNDALYGGAGDDSLNGDGEYITVAPLAVHGNDYLDGGAGADQLVGGAKDDELFGGTGNDTLFGDESPARIDGAYHGRDYLDGEADNDYLEGGGNDDILLGGSGDDVMWGDSSTAGLADSFNGNDYLDGGDGNDQLAGGGGGDQLFGGAGDDLLVGDAYATILSLAAHGNDYLDGGAGNDILQGDGGNDILFGGDGNDVLNGGTGADYMVGGAGNDTYVIDNAGDVIVESGDDNAGAGATGASASNTNVQASITYTLGAFMTNLTLTGTDAIDGAGNGMGNGLFGNDANNVLKGAGGIDYVVGGAGDDVYAFERGDGQDTVQNLDFHHDSAQPALAAAIDTVRFGSGITDTDVVAFRVGDMLSLQLKHNSDQVNVLDYFAADAVSGTVTSDHKIDRVEFSNGVTWDQAMIQAAVDRAANNQAPAATSQYEGPLLTAHTGELFSYSFDGEFIDPDGGDSLAYSVKMLDGSALPDWLLFDAQSRTLYGVADATNVGGLGFLLTATDGYHASATRYVDILILAPNRAPELYAPLENQLTGRGSVFDYRLPWNAFTDPDGDTLAYTATLSDGSPLPEWLTFDAERGNFTGVPPEYGTTSILVTARDGGNLSTTASFNIEVLNRAPVVSFLPNRGLAFGDTFHYVLPSIAFSDPDVNDSLTYSATLSDSSPLPSWLHFDPATATFDGIPGSLGVTNVRVTATDMEGSSISGEFSIFVEHSVVLNGTENADQLVGGAGNDVLNGFGGNDTLVGSYGNDRLDGGEGDDVLDGGSGSDTYVFGQNSGHDVISSYDDPGIPNTDTFEFAPDVVVGDVTVARAGDILMLTLGTGGSIAMLYFFGRLDAISNKLAQFTFADGTVWRPSDVEAMTQIATYGADELYGTDGDDVLDGGAGNDRLYGLQGDDLYRFGKGYGNDYIFEDGTYSNDTLEFTNDVLPSEVRATQYGYDLRLTIESTGEFIGVRDYFNLDADFEVEDIKFADGTVWDWGGIGAAVLVATAGDDELHLPWDGTLDGGLGNDKLFGSDSDDVLMGGGGDDSIEDSGGNDIIDGGAGNDLLMRGSGNDVYLFGTGAGHDVLVNRDNDSGKDDILRFSDMSATDFATIEHSGNDLIFTAVSGDTMRVKDYYAVGQFGERPSMISAVEWVDQILYSDFLDQIVGVYVPEIWV
jgi:Ca2+-binding RTX toxin-like protein